MLIAGASRIGKFVKSNLLREYDVDLLGLFYDFSQQASSFVRSTAGCSTTFRPDLLLQILNPYHATQLEAACLHIGVLRDEHLAIHRPVHFASPAADIVCYI